MLYKVPVTRIENVAEKFAIGTWVHFCPGAVGGDEWNSPSYVPQTNLILVAEVEWCDSVRPKDTEALKRQPLGAPWAGVQTLNPFWMFGNDQQADGYWAGWVHAVDADTGGVITYIADGAQKVAVAYGFDNIEWPTKVGTAKIAVLGLEDGAAAGRAAP